MARLLLRDLEMLADAFSEQNKSLNLRTDERKNPSAFCKYLQISTCLRMWKVVQYSLNIIILLY